MYAIVRITGPRIGNGMRSRTDFVRSTWRSRRERRSSTRCSTSRADLDDGLLVGPDDLEPRKVPAALRCHLDEDVDGVPQHDAPSRHDAVHLRERANAERDRAGHHVRHRDAGAGGLPHLVDVRERALHWDVDDRID
jgi:hypothetical protein